MPRWEDLNAYVDGALPPARRLEIERAAAAEPRVAAEIERLRAMKTGLAEGLAQGLAETSPPLPALPASRRLPHWAAAAAALLIAALLAFTLLPGEAGRDDWLRQAEASHREWLAVEPDLATAAVLPASLAGTPATFDLSLAGLTLAVAHREGEGHYLGWVGSRGCRLGLWIGPAPTDLPAALARADRDGLLLATWRSDARAFALMAGDMDPRRFATLARLLELRTRADGTQVARDAESLTLPCLA